MNKSQELEQKLKAEGKNKTHGVVYTNPELARFICVRTMQFWLRENGCGEELANKIILGEEMPRMRELSQKIANMKIWDFSVGGGVFCEEITELLTNVTHTISGVDKDMIRKHIIDKCLFGTDINEEAVDLVKSKGFKNITVEDSIFKDWGDVKFDIVIGNPPYVRSELLPKEYKDALKKKYGKFFCGRADLCVYFMDKGTEVLTRENGVMGCITTNKWLRAGYGKNLRHRLLEEYGMLYIGDFGSNKVFNAGVDTSILITRRNSNSDVMTYEDLSNWG